MHVDTFIEDLSFGSLSQFGVCIDVSAIKTESPLRVQCRSMVEPFRAAPPASSRSKLGRPFFFPIALHSDTSSQGISLRTHSLFSTITVIPQLLNPFLYFRFLLLDRSAGGYHSGDTIRAEVLTYFLGCISVLVVSEQVGRLYLLCFLLHLVS